MSPAGCQTLRQACRLDRRSFADQRSHGRQCSPQLSGSPAHIAPARYEADKLTNQGCFSSSRAPAQIFPIQPDLCVLASAAKFYNDSFVGVFWIDSKVLAIPPNASPVARLRIAHIICIPGVGQIDSIPLGIVIIRLVCVKKPRLHFAGLRSLAIERSQLSRAADLAFEQPPHVQVLSNPNLRAIGGLGLASTANQANRRYYNNQHGPGFRTELLRQLGRPRRDRRAVAPT